MGWAASYCAPAAGASWTGNPNYNGIAVSRKPALSFEKSKLPQAGD